MSFRNDFSKHKAHLMNSICMLNIDLEPFGIKLDQAQMALDNQVWIDVQQYMPLDTGSLKIQTNTLNQSRLGTGKLYLYSPNSDYGHYQHEGILYVDPVYLVGAFYSSRYGFWSRPGVAKVPSNYKLTYSQPRAEAHWGMAAMRDHEQEWVNVVRKVLNR